MRRLRVLLPVLALAALIPSASGVSTAEASRWNLQAVRAPEAWTRATGAGIEVAVIDSGIDAQHPQLAGRIVAGASWVCPKGVARPCGAWDDAHGHGTHVAGIIAAPYDGQGVAGVAPDARLMAVRVLDQNGNGVVSDLAPAVDWSVAHGADVINLSLSGLPIVSTLFSATGLDSGFAAALRRAMDNGVLVVVSAGNDSLPICENDTIVRGAGLCVGATDRLGAPAAYSNTGVGVDVLAPGGSGIPGRTFCDWDVASTWPGDVPRGCTQYEAGYEGIAGTSMATPHVSGIGALLAQKGIRGRAARDRILATTDVARRVNAAAAVA